MSGQIHSVKVQAFGTTSEAAQHYVLWIYHQIQERRGDNALDLIKWGWQLTNSGILPIEITKQVATPELLNTVKYGIKKIVYEKTANVDIMGLFTLTFSWVAGGSSMNYELAKDTDP